MKESRFKNHAYSFEMASAVRVTGEDAFDFLQSQFSNDLSNLLLDSSATVYGLWLNAKGRVLADSLVLKGEGDAYYLFSESSPASNLLKHLSSHIIADAVELESLTVVGSLIVGSDGMMEIMQSLAIIDEVDSVGSDKDAEINWAIPFIAADQGFFIYPLPDSLAGAYVCCFTDPLSYEKAIDCTKQRAGPWLSENARHFHRIASGFPLIPKEIGPNDLAAEGGLVPRAVSLNKGCFLGQEVVARLYHLGKAQRQLYVLRLEGSVDDFLEHLPYTIVCSDLALGEIRSFYTDESAANCFYAVALIKERYRDQLTTGTEIGKACLKSICSFEAFSV
ncbi:MAG: hypothetical protein CML08_02500 [Puniceicoccaceae bacterium]|nr:hypothetical protein [Puniceicoccaceae bacterium]